MTPEEEEKFKELKSGLIYFGAQLSEVQKSADMSIKKAVAERKAVAKRGELLIERIREVCTLLLKEQNNG